MSSVNDLTTVPNAAPITTPTARSSTLPLSANSLNSFSMTRVYPEERSDEGSGDYLRFCSAQRAARSTQGAAQRVWLDLRAAHCALVAQDIFASNDPNDRCPRHRNDGTRHRVSLCRCRIR